MTAIAGRRDDRRPGPPTDAERLLIRPARPQARAAVLDVWHEAWWDGHGPSAPKRLRKFRDRAGLAARIDPLIPAMKVAEHAGRIVGFVSVKDDELATLYVSRGDRGSGAARLLLVEGEAMLADAGVAEAFLWCAVGNDRAFRFYIRQGWRDGGVVQCDVDTPDGPARFPSHRMLKRPAPRTPPGTGD
jgi:ribosomal protein S18 acetylase RimI-like enzyme